KPPCRAIVDLGLLVDGSGSISENNFKKCKKFVKDMAKSFEISESGTHVGIVLFSSIPTVVFNFKKYYDVASIEKAIDGMVQPKRKTHIGSALEMTKSDLFDASSRPSVRRILIVMTDGISQDNATNAARAVRDIGVTIFTLGIGTKYWIKELNEIATDPDEDHVFTSGFDELDKMAELIKDKACKVHFVSRLMKTTLTNHLLWFI
ncbi:hypothetical protein QZH41_008963, partial [Actinostola sp. cb2023]